MVTLLLTTALASGASSISVTCPCASESVPILLPQTLTVHTRRRLRNGGGCEYPDAMGNNGYCTIHVEHHHPPPVLRCSPNNAGELHMGLFAWLKAIFIDPRMEADEKVPLRRWVRAAIAIITGGDDYGYLPSKRVRPLLAEMWDIQDKEGAMRTIAELQQGSEAWDLVRALHVARMSAGAEYVDQEESWRIVAPIAQKLQQAYSSWDEVASAYNGVRARWAAENGLEHDPKAVEEELDIVKDVYWESIPFQQDLSATSF